MSDRDQIIETITRVFHLTDQRRWEELPVLFADRVRLDYTSLQGGEPADLAPGEIVASWRSLLGTLDAHQHLVTNHLVDLSGTRVDASAAFQATHQYDGHTWTLGGDYGFRLVKSSKGWLIESMTMTAVWQTGDPKLLARAQEASG